MSRALYIVRESVRNCLVRLPMPGRKVAENQKKNKGRLSIAYRLSPGNSARVERLKNRLKHSSRL